MHCEKNSLTITRYEPGKWMPMHIHDTDKVSIMLAGSVRESSRFGDQIAHAGSIVIKPAGFEHEDKVGKRGLTVLSLRINSSDPLLNESWRAVTSDYRWLPFHPGAKLMLCLWSEEIECTESTIQELVHVLDPARIETVCPIWFRRVETILTDRIHTPPSLVELAEEVAVHPVTLSKAFASVGTSKAAMTHRIRMQIALPRLASRLPLNIIAADLGYSDAAHFSRTFQRWFGIAPEKYRKSFCRNG